MKLWKGLGGEHGLSQICSIHWVFQIYAAVNGCRTQFLLAFFFIAIVLSLQNLKNFTHNHDLCMPFLQKSWFSKNFLLPRRRSFPEPNWAPLSLDDEWPLTYHLWGNIRHCRDVTLNTSSSDIFFCRLFQQSRNLENQLWTVHKNDYPLSYA